MLRLPKCLRSMFRLRSSEASRFGTDRVFLLNGLDGRQHVQATNGRVIASATLARDKDDTLDEPGFALVDGAGLDDLCRLKPKKADVRVDVTNRSDAAVPVVVATESGDLAGSVGASPLRWPTTDEIWPRHRKVESRVAFDPDYMVAAIKAAKDASGGGALVLTIHGDSGPFVIEPSTLADGLESFHVAVAPIALRIGDNENVTTRAYPQTGFVTPMVDGMPSDEALKDMSAELTRETGTTVTVSRGEPTPAGTAVP